MYDVLAINLGGTSIKWGCPARGADFPIATMPSPQDPAQLTAVLKRIRSDIARPASAVALGFPGPIGAGTMLSQAPTLWPGVDLRRFDLLATLRSVFPDAGLHVINDVSAYGAFLLARGLRDFCVLNIGSGIGSKIYVEGAEVNGPRGRGGEIGHWRDAGAPADLRCDCGGTGHVGAVSSGRGVQRFAALRASQAPERFRASLLGGRRPIDLTAEEVAAAVRAGDGFALDILAEAMLPLARAAALLHVALGCERYVLVGGFAEAVGDALPRLLAQGAAAHCWDSGHDWGQAFEVLRDEVRTSLLGLHHHALTRRDLTLCA